MRPRPDPVGPGQESVWDFPRPPSAEVTGRRIVVELGGRVLADTVRAVRVCETSHPPSVVERQWAPGVGWSDEDPSPGFEQLRGAVAFYPGKVDRTLVDGEPVTSRPGRFYGSWSTGEVAGPGKGGPGSLGW